MISFMFFATTPSAVYTRLIARGWLEQVTDPLSGQVVYRPTMPHIDIVHLSSNPIMQTAAVLDAQGNVVSPPVPYPQTAIAVRVSFNRYLDEISEDAQYEADGVTLREQLVRTKLGKWVAANSTAVTIPGYIGNSQTLVNFPARKLNNVQIWVMREHLISQFAHNWL